MAGSLTRAARLVLACTLELWVVSHPVNASTTGSFQRVGDLIQGRDAAQLTLLADGTVLVTGGNGCGTDGCTPLAEAEVFDPKSNQFSAAGPMTTPRDDSHRAVLLKDGRVLLMGGSPDYMEQLSSAELYDPSTRTFTPIASMTKHRAAQTATVLADGRVLVVGGWSSDDQGPSASAELFDPATGRFQATGSLKTGRYRHSAVLLQDGRVAILGGYSPAGGAALTSVEIFDPKTGTFSPGGNLVEARGDASANRIPDGRIVVAGGNSPDSNFNPHLRSSVEIYDPASGLSIVLGNLENALLTHAAVSLADGRVLVAGGLLVSGDPLSSAELIDAVAGTITPTAPMTTARSNLAGIALSDGRALIVGGDSPDGSGSLNTAEVYVPAAAGGQPSP